MSTIHHNFGPHARSIIEAVVRALTTAGCAVHAKELTKMLVASGVLNADGKPPSRGSMEFAILREGKALGEKAQVERLNKGFIGLACWDADVKAVRVKPPKTTRVFK